MREAARGGVRFEEIGARTIVIGTALVFVFLAGAALGQTTTASQSGAAAHNAPIVGRLDLSAIDKSADTCGDFNPYACGNWIKNNAVTRYRVGWVRYVA